MESAARHLNWNDTPYEQMSDLIQRRFVHGDSVMLAQFQLAQGAVIPLHSHHNEQLSYIVEGALKFWVGSEDGEQITVRSGEIIVLPAHLPHKAEALEDTMAFDIFSPPRQDWINREDNYLRK